MIFGRVGKYPLTPATICPNFIDLNQLPNEIVLIRRKK
jgi:hypothetical protein